ncbi:hypothetical protein J6590_093288 [Homalodisca vitripennis]|nr:hypothetical protein J6590_093288 [Homalodisca vitripennis]
MKTTTNITQETPKTNTSLPIHRTTLYGKSPSYNGRKLWNILPTPIKQLKGAALKKRLHEFLVSRPTYTLEEFITAREDDLRRSHLDAQLTQRDSKSAPGDYVVVCHALRGTKQSPRRLP